MIAETTIFTLFRWILGLVCAIYAGIVTWQWAYGWLAWFGTTRQAAAFGRYATLLLVRIKLRRFAWELFQITLLTTVLLLLIYKHPSLWQTAG